MSLCGCCSQKCQDTCGNPVSINRGRMVTSCPCNDAPKEEFDRRRLMRLEQVRQQSKEIAENVRNKVRNEKKKQCNLFEKESEKKLKDWQARKLLELHNQYQQSLKDIGLGHKEAEVFDGIEEDLKTRKDYQTKVAAERGRLARERQQNLKSSSAPIQSRKSLTKDVKSAEETRTGTYGQNKLSGCCPKKHFYTLVDKSGEGTPIQVTPRTVSEESSSSVAKKLTDENLTDVLEETSSSSSSENGISGGSSPRSLVRHISPQTSAGDAVERLIVRSGVKPIEGNSDLKIKFKSKLQEQASVNVLGRSYDPSGRFGSQPDASKRFRGDTIEESASQRTASSLQKGTGSRLIPGSRTKGYSARFEQGGARGKSGGKNLARITEESFEQDTTDDEARPTKSRSQSRDKSLRKVGESRTKQFEQEGPLKSRSQRVSEKEKSLGRVKSSRTGPQTEQDEDTGDELPGKSRSQKVSSKSLARTRPGQQENDAIDDDSEILEGPLKSRSQRIKSRQKVAESRTKQSTAMGDLEESGKLSKSRQSKAKSLGKVAGGREQDEDTEDEETEMPGKPSKSRSQKVRQNRSGQQENDSVDDDLEMPEGPSKTKSGQKAAMDDLEESESLSKSRKSKAKSLGKVAGSRPQDEGSVDEDERPLKSKSVTQKSKSKAKSLGKVAGQDEDTVDEDEGPSKSRSVAQKSKSKAKSVGKVAGQDEDTVDEDEGPSKSRSLAQRSKSKAKSLGKVAGQDEDTVDEDEGPSKSRSLAQRSKSKAKSLGKVAGQDEDTVDEDEGPSKSRSLAQKSKSKAKSLGKDAGQDEDTVDEDERPSKSRSVVQKGKNKEKSLGKVTETDQEDDTVDEDLEVHEGRAKSRSQKIAAGKSKEKSGRVARQYEGDEITLDGKRLAGERGDNKKESQVIREPSVRHARSLSEPTTQHSSLKYPVETRISDRIKHRSAVVTNPDVCDTISDEVLIKETSRHTIRSNPDLPKPVEHRDTDIQVAPTVAQKEQSTTLDGAGESGEIPEKPTVVLKQKPVAKGGVERIDEGDLEVVADYGEGDDFAKRMERQDREAEERGKVAMQKEKTRRSYEEMMRKLPVVQRQERLSRLTVDKPEYYMSEERLKEVERKKQFEMENAYESAFPGLKPSLITTKEVTRGEKVDKEPFKVVDEAQGVKVGSWDVLKTKHGRCVCCPSQTNRERHLKNLLLNLQTQKELLLHEVDSLPKDSKLNELLGSLHNMSGDRKQPEKKRVVSPTSTSSSSPRKKPKMKCKRSVLVLQNISTQTSPATKAAEKVEKATSPRQKSPERVEEKVEKEITKICGCKGTETCGHGAVKPTSQIVVEDEKLCEIVIKIRENESQPEIFVEKSSNKKAVGDVEVKVKRPKKVDAKPKTVEAKDHKGGTWRERLSQHSTSSSTSYYSPPDVAVRMHQPRLRDVLQDKQQQTNFGTRSTTPCRRTTQTRRKLHPFIIKYIDRLLTVSRSAVEDLSVSSVSDVTTPASSITEISSNNPSLVHLKKLLKRLGITYDELHDIYGKSGKHNAVLSSLSSASTHSNEKQGRVESFACDTQDERTNTSLSARVSQEEIVDEDDEKYREMMLKYAEITESCNKKICDLTEKIEKVRMEKMQIMNSGDSSGGGNENENTTTAYLDPPNTEANTSSSTAAEQEKLDNILLTIDQSLAESLKRMTSSEIREKYPDKDIHPIEEIQPTTTQDFEPLLKDIPKLPKLAEACDPVKCCRRPPPSKGLTVAKRFNDEIIAVPHELSTIMEGDSHHSNKQLKPTEVQPTEAKKPITCEVQVQHKSSSSDELESLEKMLKDMGMGWAIATLRKTQETLALTSSSSSLDINIQQQKGVISDSSGSASEISLKGVLSRHLLAKISSTSSSTSETSISLLLKEFEDISAIFGSGSTARDGRRTSTPIQPISSKSKQCNCNSDRSGGSVNKASCTFHSLHSNGSV